MKITVLNISICIMLFMKLFLCNAIFCNESSVVELVGPLGLKDILTSGSVIFSPSYNGFSYLDAVWQQKFHKLFLLGTKGDKFGIIRLNVDLTSSTLFWDGFFDLNQNYSFCDFWVPSKGIAIDSSENYLCISQSWCPYSMKIWLLNISNSETTPVIVGEDYFHEGFCPTGIRGMAITRNAERIFLATGPQLYPENRQGYFLTYSYNQVEGMNLVEERNYVFYPFADELGYLISSPDEKHLYIEGIDIETWLDSSESWGGIFDINTYTTATLIKAQNNIPALHGVFDKSGKHIYRNKGHNYVTHWKRSDIPTTSTFGYLSLIGNYKDPYEIGMYNTAFGLSQDERWAVTCSYSKSKKKTSLSVFLRNDQDGSLQSISGSVFNIGRPFKFISPPTDGKIFLMMYDETDQKYEIYLFSIRNDIWIDELENVLLGVSPSISIDDYNHDGEVSVADLVARVIHINSQNKK